MSDDKLREAAEALRAEARPGEGHFLLPPAGGAILC
jgi:hypothetical protein